MGKKKASLKKQVRFDEDEKFENRSKQASENMVASSNGSSEKVPNHNDGAVNGHAKANQLNSSRDPSLVASPRLPVMKSSLPTVSVSEGKVLMMLLVAVLLAASIFNLSVNCIWSFIEEERVMFRWMKIASISVRVWLSVIASVSCCVFSWLMVYIDSKEPGISPPIPFSLMKNRISSGNILHLNYMFPILTALFVFLYGVFHFETELPNSVINIFAIST